MAKRSRRVSVQKGSILMVAAALILGGFFISNISISSAAPILRSTSGATLNGGTSVTVSPGATIAVTVTGILTNHPNHPPTDWKGSEWGVSFGSMSPASLLTCVNTPDHIGEGTFSESFNITAPLTPGIYSAFFRVNGYDGCWPADERGTILTLPNSIVVSSDTTPPTVTINQSVWQKDPTNLSPIIFMVIFSEPVSDFATGDVVLSGTAAATTATVSGSGAIYIVNVSGMTSSGTVIANIPTGAAHDSAGNPNEASTSTDNVVTFDNVVPTVNLSTTSASPTDVKPIPFRASFSELVPDFASTAVSVLNGAISSFVQSGAVYDFSVLPTTGGGHVTVTVNIAGGVAHDSAGNPNDPSGSVSVVYNNAPIAVDDAYSTKEDTELSVPDSDGILKNDTDLDGDPLKANILTWPAHGMITFASTDFGGFVYAPDRDFYGTDTFTYTAHDGITNSNVATVAITVNPVNDAPVANDDTYSGNEDSVLVVSASGILSNDTDVDGPLMIPTIVGTPSSGSVVLNSDGSFQYTPNPDFNGIDGFPIKLMTDRLIAMRRS